MVTTLTLRTQNLMGTSRLLAVMHPADNLAAERHGYNSHLINKAPYGYQKAVGGKCTVQIILQQRHGYSSHLINTESNGHQ